MSPEMQALLDEWHTGRTADGESPRFARRWRDARAGGFASRAYTAHVEDLCAEVARLATADGATGANVRLAVGADGETDVRVELDYEPLVTDPDTGAVSRAGKPDLRVERWRPSSGNLLDVCERGTTVRVHQAARTSFEKKLARAHALDVVDAELPDTYDALAALKVRRFELADMLDAGADVQGELDELLARDAEVRAEHDAMHVARKVALVAEDVANVDALVAELQSGDLAENQEKLEQALARQSALAEVRAALAVRVERLDPVVAARVMVDV
jgi:hypothetical protein